MESNLEKLALLFEILAVLVGMQLGLALPWLMFVWLLGAAQLIEVAFYAEFLKMSKQQQGG